MLQMDSYLKIELGLCRLVTEVCCNVSKNPHLQGNMANTECAKSTVLREGTLISQHQENKLHLILPESIYL